MKKKLINLVIIAFAITIGLSGSAEAKKDEPIPDSRFKRCPPPWLFLDPRVGGCVWDATGITDPGLPKRSFIVTPSTRVIFVPNYVAHELVNE